MHIIATAMRPHAGPVCPTIVQMVKCRGQKRSVCQIIHVATVAESSRGATRHQ